MQDIMDFIANNGFAIAVAVYLLYDRNRCDNDHKAEVDKLSESVNNNTLVMTQILEHMRKEDGGS